MKEYLEDQVKQQVSDAMSEWMDKNSPEVIREIIHQKLDARLEDVIVKSIGFREFCGRWEVDTRCEHSIISNYMKQYVNDELKEWTKKAAQQFVKRGLLKAQKEALIKHFREESNREIHRLIQNLAKSEARDVVESILQKINNVGNALEK